MMANRNRRKVLRGAEEETLDILADVLTSEEWGRLLRAPLEHAAAEGNRNVAQKLMGAGAEVGHALHAAIQGGHEEIVNDLLENGASAATTDMDGRTPLHVAAREGTTAMVQLLLLKGADKDAFDSDQLTPLLDATTFDKEGAALALLAAGADVDLRYGYPKPSVVHKAARHGNVDILRAAIERGADVNAVDSVKRTPLHDAASCNQAEAINVLVEAGASIEARGTFGCTPLHYAADQHALEVLSALLKHGADVNARDNHQSTPLHSATRKAEEEGAAVIMDSLLRAGADETILDDEGRAVVDTIDWWFEEEDEVGEEVDRVRALLANAQADRAWRRRGYLVLCRTHPDRMKETQHISGANTGAARSTRRSAKLGRTETGNCTGAAEGGITDGYSGSDWAIVVARVLGLQEEGMFRTIVGYL